MDVVAVWTGRSAAALSRALRLTNESFAAQLGVATRTVAKWNAYPELEQTPEIQQALDTLLASASEEVKARFALIVGEREVVRTAPAVQIEDVSRLIGELTSSSATTEDLDQLSRATLALAESHTRAPAKRLLGEVLHAHKRTRELLARPVRLSQQRELFRIDSDLLAHACLLLGDLKQDDAAEQYGRVALLCAQEAGANQSTAFTALAKTLRWRERFVESADAARRGYDCCAPSPVKVQLASQEANAAALLGDAQRAREALKRAEAAAEDSPNDSGLSAWSFPTARRAIFTLSVATYTGDPEMALQAAASADAGWAAGEPRVLATWAQIRAGAGIAHLQKDSLDGAVAEVTPMLSLNPELRVATVTAYLDRLEQQLHQSRFHASKEAIQLRQEIRDFNSTALSEN